MCEAMDWLRRELGDERFAAFQCAHGGQEVYVPAPPPRKAHVLRLLASGYGVKQIADHLKVHPQYVRKLRASVLGRKAHISCGTVAA